MVAAACPNRRCGRVHGRYYRATFQAAIDADASVRPVSLRYHLADGTPTAVAAFVGTDTLLASVGRIVATRGLVVEVDPGPVAHAHGAARRAMAAQTEAIMRAVAHPATHDRHNCPEVVPSEAIMEARRPTIGA